MLFGLTLGLGVAFVVYLTGAGPHAPSVPHSPSPPRARPAPLEPAPKPSPAAVPARATQGRATEPLRAAADEHGGSAGPATDKAKAKAKDTGTDFDFYEILPQSHLDVPGAAAADKPAASASSGAPASFGARASGAAHAPVETPGQYYLQAGSFRSHDEADRMQAHLALLGIESSIQKVDIDDDEYQRVRIGPISDLDRLNLIREKLRKAGVDALLMHGE